MPIPKPEQGEKTKDFISRCMGNETMVKDYKDNGQRYAICISQTKKDKKPSKASLLDDALEALSFILEYEEGFVEELNNTNIVVPNDSDYVSFGETEEDYTIEAKYEFEDPKTNEIFYYDRMGSWKKDGRALIFKGKAEEYQGRKVTLNKPFRTSNGPKKFAVYVKNESGNVVIVRFGDPNMKIKKNIPSRRKSFRARHNCDNPGPKWKARYWSCKAW
jgi:hypothetical protein